MRPVVLAALLSLLSAGAYAALTWRPPTVGLEPTVAPGGVAAEPEWTRAAAGALARPPVQTRVVTETYPVSGATEDEVLQSLLDGGPRIEGRTFFGLTTTEIDLHYRTAETAGGCSLVDVAVDLQVTVTIPEWTPSPGAPAALRQDWGRFVRALQRHEDEHRAIAVDQAEALQRSVAEARGATCTEAAAEGRHRVARLQIEAAAAHRQLDGQTGHGRTQGAVWPVGGA